ncbi:MAG TPA: FG-GAP-like repeat-containing protein [Methylomirabilota bacterium]|nr:FG-GAP-like repeat-containing protein [Methylomirabilota bacterium]
MTTPSARSRPHGESRSAFDLLVGLLFLLCLIPGCKRGDADPFTRLSNAGRNYYEKGESARAVAAFTEALRLNPTHPDAHLNLANALLLDNRPAEALHHAREVLKLDNHSAAAYFVAGCALLRQEQAEAALKELQQARDLDPTVAAASFQLGLAHQALNHTEEALTAFQETIDADPEHPAAHYRLGQLLMRAGRREEANQALEKHRQITSRKPSVPTTPATYERSRHTQIRLPFKLEQPDREGIKVTFADATAATIPDGSAWRGPVGVVDANHDGLGDLFVCVADGGFQLLSNSNGTFRPNGPRLPGPTDARYHTMLVAELHQDRFDDVIVLGEAQSHVFRFATNAGVTEVTRMTGLTNLGAKAGGLADLDFTGKLDLFTLDADGRGAKMFRNLGNFYFRDHTATSGLPATLSGATQIVLDDWNNDDLNDVLIARTGQPPLLLTKLRGGPLTPTNSPATWPTGHLIVTGDINNDLRTDLLVATDRGVECVLKDLDQRLTVPLGGFEPTALRLVDYDNDGWLDLCAVGHGLRLWRNRGQAGFQDVTRVTGLDRLGTEAIQSVETADFDGDCDTDLLLCGLDGGLKLLRNDGANANHQIKLRLLGHRSNPSGLGVRLEATAGGWRTIRTVSRLPIEIGVGRHRQIDSLTLRWFDLAVNSIDVKVECPQVLAMEELQLPTGSCPYLYAWDGERFRFVTDLLGAAPLGLRVNDHRFVEADPDEFVWIGTDATFRPRDGNLILQITEELREVLYLDQAQLVVVDHPFGTEVHATSKLVPGPPFPRHELVTLHQARPLLAATNHEGADVAALLRETDDRRVSPPRLRAPQLRGLAEPHSVSLDFGPLDPQRPWVLALTGWLRFGGGMANVAASHNPDLPFPFPQLEALVIDADGREGWRPVEVTAGAPAGKTKTILIDLASKLPSGTRQLRLATAFEIHWDRIALFERMADAPTVVHRLRPATADLHWRGYSEFEDWPSDRPLTPAYARVRNRPPWRITPAGWCTRYGNVLDLIRDKDNALALINGGDELTLTFPAAQLPPAPRGSIRNYFLFCSGWDKDADFHCELGDQIEPLPWHGMDAQRYGKQPRPTFPTDGLMQSYRTRWTGPYAMARGGR